MEKNLHLITREKLSENVGKVVFVLDGEVVSFKEISGIVNIEEGPGPLQFTVFDGISYHTITLNETLTKLTYTPEANALTYMDEEGAYNTIQLNTYTAGENITINEFNEISAIDTKYEEGDGIEIDESHKIHVKIDGDTLYLDNNGILKADNSNKYTLDFRDDGDNIYRNSIEMILPIGDYTILDFQLIEGSGNLFYEYGITNGTIISGDSINLTIDSIDTIIKFHGLIDSIWEMKIKINN